MAVALIKNLLTNLLIVAVFQHGEATKMNQCEIATALRSHGIQDNLADWVCLVQSESSGDTSRRGEQNRNGSYDYGFFQINDKYWCAHGTKGKDCKIECNSLLDDDITDDVKCAKKIFKRHGFNAWFGWKRKCNNGRAPSVDHCFK